MHVRVRQAMGGAGGDIAPSTRVGGITAGKVPQPQAISAPLIFARRATTSGPMRDAEHRLRQFRADRGRRPSGLFLRQCRRAITGPAGPWRQHHRGQEPAHEPVPWVSRRGRGRRRVCCARATVAPGGCGSGARPLCRHTGPPAPIRQRDRRNRGVRAAGQATRGWRRAYGGGEAPTTSHGAGAGIAELSATRGQRDPGRGLAGAKPWPLPDQSNATGRQGRVAPRPKPSQHPAAIPPKAASQHRTALASKAGSAPSLA